MNTVYALTDPRTNAIRYVGITKHLGLRIKNHQSAVGTSKLVSAWHKELAAEGKEISFIILESGISPENATEAEKRWIAKAKADGCDLLNVREGKKPVPRTGRSFINLRDIPPELHRAIKVQSIIKGVSMQEFILDAMAREVKQ